MEIRRFLFSPSVRQWRLDATVVKPLVAKTINDDTKLTIYVKVRTVTRYLKLKFHNNAVLANETCLMSI